MRTFTHFAAVVGLAALATPLLAQDKPSTPPAKPQNPPPAARDTGMTPHSPARGSKLVGADIVNASDKKIAEIEDLVFCDNGEIVAFVERDSGGKVFLPLSALQAQYEKQDADPGKAAPTSEVDHFLFVGDANMLATAEAVEDVENADAAAIARSREHFGKKGQMPDPKTGETGKSGDERKPGDLPGDTASGGTPANPSSRTAYAKPVCLNKLLGEGVKDSAGKDIGDVKDVAVNLNQGQVAYVVISTGGLIGGKLHGVALDKLKKTDDGKAVSIPVSEESVKSAGGEIDIDRLPMQPTLLAGTAPSRS